MSFSKDPNVVLKEIFGFAEFRPGQRQVVEHILAGRSALAVFPTGSGKSLCYQLPALMLEGMTLVVSPLIALMKDQIDFLVGKGVAAARLDSSQTVEDSRSVWDDLWEGRLKLLYVAPERFASERFLQRLQRTRISLMVIDEAHCISEWGHNFRPDYMKLAQISRELKVKRVLTLTATATPAVAKDICENFGIGDDAYVNTGFHRPNLTLRITPCRAVERNGLLLERLKTRPRGATIIYVTLQKTAEQVAEFLLENQLPARAYHAGLKAEQRHEIQDEFMAGAETIIVATIAFGMGIDKADIRYVYHLNPPKSLENHMQEIGRAGRDGQPSVCEILFCPEDIATLENFSYGDTPTQEAVASVLNELLSLPEHFDISMYDLSYTHDMRQLVVSTMLTYLELEGVLAATGPIYNEYKFQPKRSSAEMFAAMAPERVQFLKRIFSRAQKGRTWFSLDVASVVKATQLPRSQIVGALNELEEEGELVLQVRGLRHGYRFVKRPQDAGELAEKIYQRFRVSEERDIARIAQVLKLAGSSECIVRRELSYFGEQLEKDCGHCDRCLGEKIPRLPDPVAASLSKEERRLLAELKAEAHSALSTSRQLTRFLCGISSPATSRAKLGRDSRFGALAHYRFAEVEKVLRGSYG
jgi:ATP-dependent DNA helicase RecQ